MDKVITCIISIHAPHTGRDAGPGGQALRAKNFNPRAPYGARPWQHLPLHPCCPFQSTRPIRGATVRAQIQRPVHAGFQSTRPIRGATHGNTAARSDRQDFNPRAPYGARLAGASLSMRSQVFQSTRPIRGATARLKELNKKKKISIHAPHTGRDTGSYCLIVTVQTFQSTRPIRGATRKVRAVVDGITISIHAPHTGRDSTPAAVMPPPPQISIHAPHTGRDSHSSMTTKWMQYFNPRAPYGARPGKGGDGDG